MDKNESTVRVWVGLDLLQTKLMEQTLLANGIECFSSRDAGMLLMGGQGELGIWVAKKDEGRARALLEQAEEEMSQALDAESQVPETDS